MILAALLAVAAARAELPPPDYREELGERAAADVAAMAADGDVDGAVRLARRFTREVAPLPAVLYEEGLALYRAGRTDAALRAYDRCLELDPNHAAARYDRGEIRLARGDLDGAREDFAVAAREAPDHWAVHFRLAHLAALDRDPRAFEAHLLDALRHGFDFRTIVDDPQWKAWARDPELGPVLERLIVVYSDEALLDRLRAPADAGAD